MTKQLEILWHALGVTPESRRPCRFHFVTGDGSGDHADCLALVKLGLMQQHPPSCLTGGDDLFTVTDAGRTFALSSLPDPHDAWRAVYKLGNGDLQLARLCLQIDWKGKAVVVPNGGDDD